MRIKTTLINLMVLVCLMTFLVSTCLPVIKPEPEIAVISSNLLKANSKATQGVKGKTLPITSLKKYPAKGEYILSKQKIPAQQNQVTTLLANATLHRIEGMPTEINPKKTINISGELGDTILATWPKWMPTTPLIKNDTRIHFSFLDVEQGLSANGANVIVEDQQGKIWIGTDKGLNLWDGQGLQHFSTQNGLCHASINDLLATQNGLIYIATDKGLSIWDGNYFINFKESTGLPHHQVNCLLESQTGAVWIGTQNGLVIRTDKGLIKHSFFEKLPKEPIVDIIEDSNGSIWIAQTNHLSHWNRKQLTQFPLAKLSKKLSISCLTIDLAGNICIGTRRDGLILIENPNLSSTIKIFQYKQAKNSVENAILNNRITSLNIDNKGQLWVGTFGGGVTVWETLDKSFAKESIPLNKLDTYTYTDGLSHNVVYSIIQCKDGKNWIGTEAGLSILNTNKLYHFSTKTGLNSDDITYLFEDSKGRCWIGTFGGGFSLWTPTNGNREKGTFRHFTEADGLIGNVVLLFMEDTKGRIWIGTSAGISIWDGNGFYNYSEETGLVGNHIEGLIQAMDGTVWIGTNNGVSIWDGKETNLSGTGMFIDTFQHLTTTDGLLNNEIMDLLEDQYHNIWIATEAGLNVWNGEYLINYTTKEGLTGNEIWVMREDCKGQIWIGTSNNGLSVWKGQSASAERGSFTNYTIEHGLLDNTVLSLAQSDCEDVWLGTMKGLHRIEPSEAKAGMAHQTYLSKDGLSGIRIQDLIVDQLKRVWIGTTKGLNRMNGLFHQQDTLVPQLFLRDLQPFFEEIDWRQTKLATHQANNRSLEATKLPLNAIEFTDVYPHSNLPIAPSFPATINNLTLSWSAIHWAAPEQLQFTYILEGKNDAWSPLVKNQEVTYQDLGKGHYTFKVKALAENGQWSEPITYDFSIRAPWWQTFWAILTYVLSIIFSFWLFGQWRTRLLKNRQKELEQIIVTRTAEVVAEQKRSEDLLLNILPKEVAEELKQFGTAKTKNYEMVTVLFIDIKNFTKHSEQFSPEDLVAEIDYCFKAFDIIIENYNVEKIKTVGDAYLAVAGLPAPNKTNPIDAVQAAIAISRFMKKYQTERAEQKRNAFKVRIGLHTGPVIAGIVGTKKFAYDIWGDTVNIAARMESSSKIGKINISATTYELIKKEDGFNFEYRGKMQAKNKGLIDMYFVEQKVLALKAKIETEKK